MTISSEISTAGPYDGNGATKIFPYGFRIVDEDHIRVVLQDIFGVSTDLSLVDGDYTVSGVGNDAGGNVTVVVAPAIGQKLTLLRNPPFTQETDLANQGPYNAEVVEDRFDMMVMQIQTVKEITDRSIQVSPGQTPPTADLIEAAEANAEAAAASALAAGEFAQDASESAALAAEFANNPEDVAVLPGLYSAFHFMKKAQAAFASVIAGFAAAIHAATAKTALVAADELGFWDSVSGALRKITMTNFWAQAKWQACGIGSWYTVDTSKAGAEIPPISDPTVTFIELTAGLTGTGAYNNGKLTTESVSGSAPLVLATAVISVTGSPMNGQTIDLINTEGRILRPSASPGAKQNDQLQGFIIQIGRATSSAGQGAAAGSSPSGTLNSSPTDDGTNGTPRTGLETRMKNLGVKAYMRVK